MNKERPPGERLTYTMAEACVILGISEDLGYQLAAAGDLPILQLGRRKLIPRAALERMVAHAERVWEKRHDRGTTSDQIREPLDGASRFGAGSANR